MFCSKCGTQLSDGTAFCQKCGAKIVRTDAPQQASVVSAQTSPPTATMSDFKDFVDNHVRATTKFQSAEVLLKNSKPWLFSWVCFGAVALAYLILGLTNDSLSAIGFVVLVPFCGFVATFITSAIIRNRYKSKFSGAFSGDINIEDLAIFLNEHLQQIYPHFHEWGYLTKAGLLAALENTIASTTDEVRICTEFGPQKKNLVAFYIKPKSGGARPGEMLYFVDALKNGFLIDGRAAGFLGHGSLIRTAPILQAAMEYYLKNQQG